MFDSAKLRVTLPRKADIKVTRPSHWAGRTPSVTVVIPCYNYGHYITACVRSVLDQGNVDVDILVIDDASPDGSADIVASLPDYDNRIRVICRAENLGHIATYNEGLAQARGDYTVLLSADDMLTPGCLARATALMESHPRVGMTYGTPMVFDDGDIPLARSSATAWIIWHGRDWVAHRCKTGYNPIRSPETVMRTSVLHEIGYYRAALPHAADFELWMRAAAVSDIGYVAGADQAYYRVHATNMHRSSFDMTADLAQRLRCFDTIFQDGPASLRNEIKLRDMAHRTLAREGLRRAISVYLQGVSDDELVDRYADFARQTWPGYQQLAEWRALGKLRGARAVGGNPKFLLAKQRAANSVEYNLRWWRHRWAGI
jgi:glycosyltransferase involved in cell wall biosynthesis